MSDPLPTLADIQEAREALRGVAVHTPMEESRWLSDVVGGPVLLKAESLQRTGSFKIRGAYLRISRLSEEGILNVMRLEWRPPREMLRALVTAVASLRRAGAADPARHVIMMTGHDGRFTALLVKRTPFTKVPLELPRSRRR